MSVQKKTYVVLSVFCFFVFQFLFSSLTTILKKEGYKTYSFFSSKCKYFGPINKCMSPVRGLMGDLE